MSTVKAMEKQGTQSGKPRSKAKIVDCGQLDESQKDSSNANPSSVPAVPAENKNKNPFTFFELSLLDNNEQWHSIGTVFFELFADQVPRTAENFRQLCTGEHGKGQSGKPLHFKGSMF